MTTIQFIKTCFRDYVIGSFIDIDCQVSFSFPFWEICCGGSETLIPRGKNFRIEFNHFNFSADSQHKECRKRQPLGKKAKDENQTFSQVEWSPNRSLGSNSCRKKRGLGGQMRVVQRFLLMRGSGVARFSHSQIKPYVKGEQRIPNCQRKEG